jgi:sugar phosphate isomerase/epimerase
LKRAVCILEYGIWLIALISVVLEYGVLMLVIAPICSTGDSAVYAARALAADCERALLSAFVDGFGTEKIGAYFDIGNSLRNGFPEDWIRILGHRIRAVHIKDFKRSVDTINGFCGILQGDVNWDEVSLSLQEIGYERWLTGEVLPAYKYSPEILVEETSRAMSAVFQI